MDLKEKVGQTLILGFNGHDLKAHDYERIIRELKPAGFRLNTVYTIEGWNTGKGQGATITPYLAPEKYAGLLEELQKLSLKYNGRRLFFSLDQEGGANSNFNRGLILFPYPMGYGVCLDPKDVEEMAYTVGRQLMSVGINLIHGPVLDINCNPKNPGMGVRSFHSRTDIVSEFGRAALRGYTRAGIIASVKHLPGKGDIAVDTHFEATVVPHSLDLMLKRELAPFKALIDDGADVLMTSHVIVPSFGDDKYPFTISKPGIDIIRERLGFTGVLETDHIMMEGLAQFFPAEELGVRCILAGNDLILYKLTPFAERLKVRDAIVQAVEEGRIPMRVLDSAVERVSRLQKKYGLDKAEAKKRENPSSWIKDKKVLNLSREHHRRMCLVTRDTGLLPLAKPGKVLAVEVCGPYGKDAGGDQAHLGMLKESLAAYIKEFEYIGFGQGEIKANRENVLAKIKGADLLIITCFTRAFGEALQFTRDCCGAAKKSLAISFSPYHSDLITEATAVITNFSDALFGLEAAAAVAFGKAEPGKIKRKL